MNQTQKEQIIVRGTGEYWQYSIIRGGFLRVVANAVEDNFAAFGRTLLLFFLIYCGMKGAALLVAPGWTPPLWLELVMFGLQVGGLEGGIPGLSRRRLELREKNDQDGVRRLSNTIGGARFMNIAAVAEGVLHLMFGDTHGPLFGFTGPDAHYMQVISGILLVVRVWIIIDFLMELAQVDAKGPRIVSKEVFEKEQTKQEQEDGRTRQITELKEQLTKTVQEKQALANVEQIVQRQMNQFNQQLQVVHSTMPQVVQSQVQEVVQSLIPALVQSVVQSQARVIISEIHEVVQSQVQEIVFEQVQAVREALEASTSAADFQELAERLEAVSSTVQEMHTTITEVRTVSQKAAIAERSTKTVRGGSRQKENEPLRVVHSTAKKVESEPAVELLAELPETRVKRFILEQVEQGHTPSLTEIMNQCKVSKNTAIRYRREMLDGSDEQGDEPETGEMEIVTLEQINKGITA